MGRPTLSRLGATKRQRLEPFLPRLFAYAVTLAGDRGEAEDMVHDCVVKVLAAASVPSHELAYSAWIFRVLRNLYLDRVRARRRAPPMVAVDGQELPATLYWPYDEAVINGLTVRMGLARISEAHREIIALVDLAGFSYKETAGILDVAVGTVMSRLSRARLALLNEVAGSNLRRLPERRSDAR